MGRGLIEGRRRGENLQHATRGACSLPSFEEAEAAPSNAAQLPLSPAGWCPLTCICNVPPSPVCYLFLSLPWRFFFCRDCEF